jgi:uncharacterized membrane protein YraQ (UPF0718 family)
LNRGKSNVFDANLLVLVGVLAALCALAWWRGGEALVVQGFSGGARLLLRFGLVIIVSFLAAGFIETLIPQTWVKQQLGADAGARGIWIAAGVGMITPAGPFVSMPVAAVMLRAGAGAGPVVAFLTAWSLLSLHRFIAWEVPILGFSFAATRFALSFVLPIVAGFAARALLR